MKRQNVVIDEKLLEEARRASGERTYSGTIMKALQELVRVDRLDRALDEFYAAGAKGDLFHPEFLQEHRATALSAPRKHKISAHEKREPRTGKRRGAR